MNGVTYVDKYHQNTREVQSPAWVGDKLKWLRFISCLIRGDWSISTCVIVLHLLYNYESAWSKFVSQSPSGVLNPGLGHRPVKQPRPREESAQRSGVEQMNMCHFPGSKQIDLLSRQSRSPRPTGDGVSPLLGLDPLLRWYPLPCVITPSHEQLWVSREGDEPTTTVWMPIKRPSVKGRYQCYYMSLSFVSIGHIGHNPTHFF